ncbi:hypothetical protein J6590_018791 [Homalodisca vitripennis]|nr:hypothetical protein J6590_018791 [Homalodisca vitripennis]
MDYSGDKRRSVEHAVHHSLAVALGRVVRGEGGVYSLLLNTDMLQGSQDPDTWEAVVPVGEALVPSVVPAGEALFSDRCTCKRGSFFRPLYLQESLLFRPMYLQESLLFHPLYLQERLFFPTVVPVGEALVPAIVPAREALFSGRCTCRRASFTGRSSPCVAPVIAKDSTSRESALSSGGGVLVISDQHCIT